MAAFPDEWEVLRCEYIPEDRNFEVDVIKWGTFDKQDPTNNRTATIRMSYRVTVGRYLRIPKLL